MCKPVHAATKAEAVKMMRKAKVVYGGVVMCESGDPTYVAMKKGDALEMLRKEVGDHDKPLVMMINGSVYIN